MKHRYGKIWTTSVIHPEKILHLLQFVIFQSKSFFLTGHVFHSHRCLLMWSFLGLRTKIYMQSETTRTAQEAKLCKLVHLMMLIWSSARHKQYKCSSSGVTLHAISCCCRLHFWRSFLIEEISSSAEISSCCANRAAEHGMLSTLTSHSMNRWCFMHVAFSRFILPHAHCILSITWFWLGLMHGPINGEKMTVFIDDVNASAMDGGSYQTANEVCTDFLFIAFLARI